MRALWFAVEEHFLSDKRSIASSYSDREKRTIDAGRGERQIRGNDSFWGS